MKSIVGDLGGIEVPLHGGGGGGSKNRCLRPTATNGTSLL